MRWLGPILLFCGCASAASSGEGDTVADLLQDTSADLTGTAGGDDGPAAPPADLRQGGMGQPDLRRPPAPDLAMPGDDSYPRVNEVVPNAGGKAVDEYVELIGANHDIPLSGWTLRYQTATGSVHTLVSFGAVTLPARGYLLVAAQEGKFGAAADVRYAGGMYGSIAKAGAALGLFDPGGIKIDSLGYGTAMADFVEDQPAPDPGNLGASRIPDGADTDHNQTDVKIAPLTPKAANHL